MTSCPQILGFRFTWGVEMMPQHYSWDWYPPQTTSYIHIRHIKSVWAIGMLSQWYMGAALYSYAGQAGPRFGKPASLEEWKWCYLKSCSRLIFTSDHFIHPYSIHTKCLSHWYAVSRAYCCTLTVTLAKLPPDLGIQCWKTSIRACPQCANSSLVKR